MLNYADHIQSAEQWLQRAERTAEAETRDPESADRRAALCAQLSMAHAALAEAQRAS
jgi:alkyl hydroperoxide reductase subunit AhpC